MADDVPTPDELSDRLAEAMNKGIDLHPDWSINYLFPPSDVVIELIYPEDYMKYWEKAYERKGELGIRLRTAEYATKTNEGWSESDKSNLEKWSMNDYITKYLEGVLNAETTWLKFNKNWKWVNHYAISKALDMPYTRSTFTKKGEELEAIEDYNVASADLTQKAWEHFLNRFVWEQDGKYWLVRIRDFSVGPPKTSERLNMRSYVPSKKGGKAPIMANKTIDSFEDLEEAINSETLEVEVFMWWEKPQMRWSIQDDENEPLPKGRKDHPKPLYMMGKGVSWSFKPYFQGKTLQSHNMRKDGKVWNQPHNFAFSSALKAVMISNLPDLSCAFYETNGAQPLFPEKLFDKDDPSYTEYKKRVGYPITLAEDMPTFGYCYYLARGNEVSFINREFMW